MPSRTNMVMKTIHVPIDLEGWSLAPRRRTIVKEQFLREGTALEGQGREGHAGGVVKDGFSEAKAKPKSQSQSQTITTSRGHCNSQMPKAVKGIEQNVPHILGYRRNGIPRGGPDWRELQRPQLTHTRQQISALQARLEILDVEHEGLEQDLENSPYPILSIPAELICEIFLASLPANGRPKFVVIGGNCTLNPAVVEFSRFYFPEGPSAYPTSPCKPAQTSHKNLSQLPYDGVCALLRTWFRRAKGVPLSITLCCASDRSAMPPKMLPAIAEFCAQRGRLELTLPFNDIPILDSITGPFPQLQSFAVNLSTPRPPPHQPLLTALLAAPQLRSARLLHGLTVDDLRVGSCALTTLELQGELSQMNWSTIFANFTQLRHFTAALEDGNVSAFTNVPPLESLIIKLGDPLDVLTLPHLRRLQCFVDGDQITSFLAFLSRSACVLTQLSLCAWYIDDGPLIQCLQAVPHLMTLKIRRMDHPRHRYLYDRMQEPGFLPHLEHLNVVEDAENYTFESVLAMLHVRQVLCPGSMTRLRTFFIHLDRNAFESEDDAAAIICSIPFQLHHWAEDGLRICVTTQKRKWPADAEEKSHLHVIRQSPFLVKAPVQLSASERQRAINQLFSGQLRIWGWNLEQDCRRFAWSSVEIKLGRIKKVVDCAVYEAAFLEMSPDYQCRDLEAADIYSGVAQD
ncbi:hypothetical protein B0H16DRAFT_1697442 [Mycena metata]|uniref:F-box domain-containing protein n=1 Tax=Mycena metata TaxID=1033252 RepID=A0AAD7HUD5_9AGAR|nr:hypothetical protein B0H16DRAFT_1697442 [Mycena metata]